MKKTFTAFAIGFFIFIALQISVFPFGNLATKEKGNIFSEKEAPASSNIFINMKIPLFSPLFSNFPVAVVNGEAISLDDMKNSLGSMHENSSGENAMGNKDFNEIVNRLINAKLIMQEASDIGLYDLPDITEMTKNYSNELLIEMLQEKHIENIKADDEEVEKIYMEEVKELKIKSVLFEKEEDAQKMVEEIKSGKSFDEIAGALISGESAKGDLEGSYLKVKDMQPAVFKAVSEMETGEISPVVPIPKGFSVFKIEEVRYPENIDLKEKITQEIVSRKRLRSLVEYNKEISKKYVKLNEKLIDKIDFESQNPGFEKLLEDKRVVAEIDGGTPITVAEWAEAIKQKYFHGAERAIEKKRINRDKFAVLEKIIGQRTLTIEAIKNGIDKTDEYLNMVKDYRDSLVFNEFLKKAVAPNIKMDEEDIEKYYEEHKMEYTYSEMLKVNVLGFENRDFAESALKKLELGADFGWMKDNADGQVDKISDDILSFENNVVATDSLSDGIKNVLPGVKKGDFRLYESPEGSFYVFYVKELYPAVPQPLEEIRDLITNKIFGEKLNEELRDWETNLREQSDIKIFFQSEESL